MKKLSLVLVMGLSLSTVTFAQVSGSDGQINFTGTVTEKGCVIEAGSSGAATINLGSMPKASLKGNANTAWGTGQIRFFDCNLEVEEGEEIKSVSITVNSGIPADFSNSLWANNGSATGVGIEVEIGGSAGVVKVSPAGVPEPINAVIDTVNDTATYTVRGRMVGDAEVTAGTVDSTISFVASYK